MASNFNPYSSYIDNKMSQNNISNTEVGAGVNQQGAEAQGIPLQGSQSQGNIATSQRPNTGFGQIQRVQPKDYSFGQKIGNDLREVGSAFGDLGRNIGFGEIGSSIGDSFKENGAGGVLGGATAVAGIAGNIAGVNKDMKDIETTVSGTAFGPDGQPLLTTADEIGEREALAEQDVGQGLIASSTLSGTAGGMSVGGPWGALAGGVAGLFSGIFGKKKAKQTQNDKLKEFNEGLMASNNSFNDENQNFSNINTSKDADAFRKKQSQRNLTGVLT